MPYEMHNSSTIPKIVGLTVSGNYEYKVDSSDSQTAKVTTPVSHHFGMPKPENAKRPNTVSYQGSTQHRQ